MTAEREQSDFEARALAELRAHVRDSGQSLATISTRMGLSKSALWGTLSGRNSMSFNTCARILAALDLEAELVVEEKSA